MTRLDQEHDVISLAVKLGVKGAAPVEGILDHCYRRIDGWVAEKGGVADIEALESLVTQRLQMTFEEIRDDADFGRLTEVYARGKKDPVFASMRMWFDDADNPIFGMLVKLKNVADDALVRFVAIIDCRGNKLARRFFTRWHEIAHRLTTHANEGETEPAYRSEHDPIERLMDEIAGHVGFYDPLFQPVYQQATEGVPHLRFATVETVIGTAFPAASFQATLFACTRRLPTPVIYLEAALDHKKEVKRKLATPSLFDVDPPPGELRVVKVRANDAAFKDKFFIPEKMRVPAASVIHRLFDAEPQTDGDGEECLSNWESQGRSLGRRAVIVDARKVPDRVIAIVQPVETARPIAKSRANGLWDQENTGS